jgi:hypothetical protein
VVCAKCGGRGNKIDVRPNWKEQPPQASLTIKGLAMTVIFRQALIAIAVAVIVVAIADFVLWGTATESEPSEAPNAEMVR